jgi:hypothetical protein
MASKRKMVRTLAPRHTASGFSADFADLFRSLTQTLFDTYRPELHYMRGPGPKWHAKHAPARASVDMVGMPALVRVKAR